MKYVHVFMCKHIQIPLYILFYQLLFMDMSAKHCQKTFTISDDPPGDCDHVQCTSLGEIIKFPSSLSNYLTVASPVWIIMTHQPYSMYTSYQKSCISHMMHARDFLFLYPLKFWG